MKVNLNAYVHVEGFPRGPLFKSLNDWSFGKQSQLFLSRAIIRCLYGNFRQKNSNQTGDIKEELLEHHLPPERVMAMRDMKKCHLLGYEKEGH